MGEPASDPRPVDGDYTGASGASFRNSQWDSIVLRRLADCRRPLVIFLRILMEW